MLFLLSLDILFSIALSLVMLVLRLFFVVCVIVGVVSIFRFLTGRMN